MYKLAGLIEKLIYFLWLKLFARRFFYIFNQLLFKLSLMGMGFLNAGNYKESGEKNFLKIFFLNFKEPVIFDIGANKGTYVQECLNLKQNALIYAFEPHPDNFKTLRNLSQKHGFYAVNKALGSENAKLFLYDYDADKQGVYASLHKDVIEKIHSKNIIEYETETIKLDDFMENNNIENINLLKIDTEGHELEVLKGAKNALKSNKIDIIQFEFNEMSIISRSFLKDFVEILENYTLYRLIPKDFIKINYDEKPVISHIAPAVHEIFAFQNIIAVRKDLNIKF